MKQPQGSLKNTQVSVLRIAGVMDDSVVDGPGVRYTVFTQGCSHNCPGCHNPGTHDYKGGYEAGIEDIIEDLKNYKYIKGVTFSGGEPLDQPQVLKELITRLKGLGYHVLIYTGYTFEELKTDSVRFEALKEADMLIDGPFMAEKRTLDLPFRGSSNQRMIDIKKSVESNTVVEVER